MKSRRNGRERRRSKSARKTTVPFKSATMTRSLPGEILFDLAGQGVDAAGQLLLGN